MIREVISVRECLGQKGRNAWLLEEMQADKDIIGMSPVVTSPPFPI